MGQQSRVLPKVTPLFAVGQRTRFEGILEPLQITAQDTDSDVGVSAPCGIVVAFSMYSFWGEEPSKFLPLGGPSYSPQKNKIENTQYLLHVHFSPRSAPGVHTAVTLRYL